MEYRMWMFSCSLLCSGLAYAECPNSLPTRQLIECITVEGSGEDNYQDWKAEFEQRLASNPQQKETESTISQTLPGVDITKIAPAAGDTNKP